VPRAQVDTSLYYWFITGVAHSVGRVGMRSRRFTPRTLGYTPVENGQQYCGRRIRNDIYFLTLASRQFKSVCVSFPPLSSCLLRKPSIPCKGSTRNARNSGFLACRESGKVRLSPGRPLPHLVPSSRLDVARVVLLKQRQYSRVLVFPHMLSYVVDLDEPIASRSR